MSTGSHSAPVEEDPREQSFGTLISELSSDVATLVRQEIELAKVELTAKAKDAGKGVGMMAGAAVVGLAMFGAFTAFLISLIATWIDSTWAAALIVTVLYGIVAFVLVKRGQKQLKEAAPPKPEQTIETVKEDVQWAKTQMRSDRT